MTIGFEAQDVKRKVGAEKLAAFMQEGSAFRQVNKVDGCGKLVVSAFRLGTELGLIGFGIGFELALIGFNWV